jgi:hypothetical protein
MPALKNGPGGTPAQPEGTRLRIEREKPGAAESLPDFFDLRILPGFHLTAVPFRYGCS